MTLDELIKSPFVVGVYVGINTLSNTPDFVEYVPSDKEIIRAVLTHKNGTVYYDVTSGKDFDKIRVYSEVAKTSWLIPKHGFSTDYPIQAQTVFTIERSLVHDYDRAMRIVE